MQEAALNKGKESGMSKERRIGCLAHESWDSMSPSDRRALLRNIGKGADLKQAPALASTQHADLPDGVYLKVTLALTGERV